MSNTEEKLESYKESIILKKVNIFLSYCRNDSSEADRIYNYFKSNQNIELHIDKLDIEKWGSIKEYVQSIINMDYIILLISDSYLKSANCMYEVLEVMRDRNYRDKIFPVVFNSGIYSPIEKAKYVKHWQDETRKLEDVLKEIDLTNLGGLSKHLKQRQDISSNIAKFLDVISDMNNPNVEDVCVRIQEKLDQKGFLGTNQIKDENELIKVIDYIKVNINDQKGGKVEYYSEILKKSRTRDYASKWNQNVFLNNYSERDENGVNIKLNQLYLEEYLPHYIWKSNTTLSCDLKELLKEYIIDNNDKKMLLVLGQPGIGKSTLITWIMANLVERKDRVLVCKFAPDLQNIDWQGDNILSEIFKTLNLEYSELENRTLILDGFDEIHSNSDRERILNRIYQELNGLSYVKKFSLLITCRKNYIYELFKLQCDYITLQIWNNEQIGSFCKTYGRLGNSNISQSMINKILENREIFGIPLILYMVLALNISIDENGSILDIYERIFSLDNGVIYDRCIEYISYGKQHRISLVKQQIHQISQRIAFWIFENNPEKAFIPQSEFKKICDIDMNEAESKSEDIQSDTLIGSYFKISHCEGILADEVHFAHRSIYEYFVAVYFFESIKKMTSKEEVAGELGELLKYGKLSKQISKFIKYKFDTFKEENLPDITRDIFNIMLRDGMTYYVKKKYKDVISQEMNIFINMLEVVHLWNPNMGKLDGKISNYLRYSHKKILRLRGIELGTINLSGVHLSDADLIGADLSMANLSVANLMNANLSKANLIEAHLADINLMGADLTSANLTVADLIGANLKKAELIGVNLTKANLTGAYLEEAELIGADLSGANLSGANLSGANLFRANLLEVNLIGTDLMEALFDEEQVKLLHKKYDLSNSMVFIFETKEIVDYKEYCIRNQG